MPLYEYECFVCAHRFERIQRVADPVIRDCPECGGSVRRLLGVPALQFKGSGWYVTDYGKGNGGTPASASNGESTSSTPKDKDSKAAKDSTSSSSSDTPSKTEKKTPSSANAS